MHWTWPAVPVGNKHIVYGIQTIPKIQETTMLVNLSSKGMKGETQGSRNHAQFTSKSCEITLYCLCLFNLIINMLFTCAAIFRE